MASYAILTNRYKTTPQAGANITDWEYNIGGTNIVLSKYVGASPIVVVPNTIGNYNVVLCSNVGNSSSIYNGQPFYGHQGIESVTISGGVGILGNLQSYFAYCTNLKTVDVRNCNGFSCNNARSMFSDCSNLIRVYGPASWRSSPPFRQYHDMFCNCRNLIESPIVFNGSQLYNGMFNMFAGCQNLTTIPVIPAENGVTTIDCNQYEANFYDCRKLKNIPIRNYCLGNNSFHNCHSLEEQPPNGDQVSNVINAFKNCYNLKGTIEIRNPDCTRVDSLCENCYNITGVVYSNYINLTSANNAFRNCRNLVSVQQLNRSQIASASFLDNTFRDCHKLTTVPWAFYNDRNYSYTYYNTGITAINRDERCYNSTFDHTFGNCKNLISIEQSNIFNGAVLSSTFVNCTNLTTVSYITNCSLYSTFAGCSNLTTVGSLTYLRQINDAFQNCRNLTEVNIVHINSSGTQENAFRNCTSLRYINTYQVVNSRMIASNFCRDCVNLKQINVVNGFSGGLDNAFRNCFSLTSINLASPSSNFYYMNYAFANCTNLKGLVFSNIPRIIPYMCQGCTNLTDFKIDYNFSTSAIDSTTSCYAFAQCPNLRNINTISTHNSSNFVLFSFNNAEGMFQDCSNINKIPFYKSNFYNTNSCFENCANLTIINLSGQFGMYASTFRDTPITTIDDSGVYLRLYAPAATAVPMLTTLNGHGCQTDLVNNFENCANLTTVTNLSYTAPNYFCNCKKLTSVSFNNSSQYDLRAGTRMFYNCNNLVSVGGIFQLNNASEMFDGCTKLTGNIYINATNVNNMYHMFANTSLVKNLYIPFSKNNTTTTQSTTYNTAIANGINGVNGVRLYNIWNVV